MLIIFSTVVFANARGSGGDEKGVFFVLRRRKAYFFRVKLTLVVSAECNMIR